ncbi:lytic transglycosylase domain-containing protein [Salmonella enterica subsp. enterica]|nr:lytic transglycosylase domain-containing protein [Salmonella enterica subsp. enterica]EDA0852625.1 lytic transglycosylase domain-containing protein [Salmonella enterica]EIV7027913.1 transglycosylase SLT domain-containing protein [Salmonella enterica]EIW3704009.1 transglycosylase SLT domain-containing protein [Salmonella enterica]
MAGNQMPVLTLDVNEEQLKRLEAIFEKYQNGLKIGPGGFPVNIPPQTSTGRSGAGSFSVPSSAGRKSDSQFVSNYNGRGETMFDKYLSGLGKNAQATLKTYKQINSTLRTTTSRINNLFKTTVVWGTRLTAMGIAGPFGFGMMARNVVEKQKNADELQATPGELKAAESTYSPYFSGVGNLLNTLAAAQNDTQHPAYSGLIGLGINPKKGAAENLPVLLERVAALAKEYEGTGLTQSMLRGRNLGWVNFGIANQLVKYQDKIPELNKEFLLRASQNDSLLTSGHTSQYQNLTSNLENNWDRLTSGFQGAMAGNAPLLLGISNGLTNSLLNFMQGENFKSILTDVKDGLESLGKYINGPEFNKDLNDFAGNVAKVVKALSGFVGFAAEHPWLFGAALLAGPSRIGAIAATGVGVTARVVGGSLLGATAGTVAGLAIPTNNTPTTSEEMKGLEGRFNFDYFNEVQEWQKNNPGKVWPGKTGGDNNANLSQKEKLLGMVREKARAALLPENLLETVIGIESGWNPNAISEKGAMGLLQFIKSTGNAYKLYGKDFFDPDKSTDAGVNYFLDNSSRYQGDIAKMLAQYNGGNIAVGKDNTLRLKLESVNYLLKALEGIPELRTQRPMLEGKLQAAKQVLASNPDGRAIIQLEILEKPGASYSAQLAGQLIPR